MWTYQIYIFWVPPNLSGLVQENELYTTSGTESPIYQAFKNFDLHKTVWHHQAKKNNNNKSEKKKLKKKSQKS
jgi:hypothetical protein